MTEAFRTEIHPGYLSQKEAEQFAGLPIGSDRPLTIFEEDWMLSSGLAREDISRMTPAELREHAETTTAQSEKFLGS